MSLLIENAITREGKKVNIRIEEGVIKEITKTDNKFNQENFEKIINANESLVTESLISPHIHLDKALISDIIDPNISGTLWEAIEKTWEVKRNYSVENIKQRACHCIDEMIKYGVTHLRTHADIDSIGGLLPLKSLLELKEMYKDIVDIQIVAFPQEGIIKDEGTEELLYKALESGATLLGGMPHNEYTVEDSHRHIDILFEIAKEFNVDIDSHTDETDDPNSKTLQYLAAKTIKENYTNRVTVDHICSLSAQDDYYATRVIDLVKKAGIHVVTNPGTNMVLQGRLDRGTQRVGITRVKELINANVNVTCGQDCINDPYYPFGKGDMLEVSNLLGHAAKMTTDEDIRTLYDMITYNAAKLMGLAHHQLIVGNPANLIVLHGVKNVNEAIRKTPPARSLIRNGKILSQTKIIHDFFYKILH